MRTTITRLSAAVLLGLSAPTFAAFSHHAPDERSQAAQSDLVFVGSVTHVEYRQSGKDGDTQRVPHTFVTYSVEDVIHGNAGSKQITLRFVGGRGDKARFLSVSGQPMFDQGDRDLLMVANNGTAGCPLVGCANGRYRFIQGKVFTEEGQAIELDAKGQLVKAGFFNLPEVMTHKVSQTVMTLEDHFEQGESRVDFAQTKGGAHLDDSQLIARVKESSRALNNATPDDFKTARIDQPFDLSIEVAAPPVDRQLQRLSTHGDEVFKSSQERAEAAALKASGGNPAMGEYKEELTQDQNGEKK